MLSRKKTKNEVSKPAEVQGKYVKKETSPLLRSECRQRDAPTPGWAVAGSGDRAGRPGGLLLPLWSPGSSLCFLVLEMVFVCTLKVGEEWERSGLLSLAAP